MAVGEFVSIDPQLIRVLARHLESLKHRTDNLDLRRLIEGTLRACRQHGYVNGSCIAYLHAQLFTYVCDRKKSPASRVRARLIQQHLAAHLPQYDKKIAASQTGQSTESILRRTSGETLHGAKPNLEQIKQRWIDDLSQLQRQHDALAQKLKDAAEYLKTVEIEKQQLQAELERAHKRASSRALPRRHGKPAKKPFSLPKRDVFVRQLEAEVGRARRYPSPLALALIDVESLGGVAGEHEPEAAEAVRRCYANEILGNFRTYDLVARYDDDEFAVLFPNTEKESARRALEKTWKRANEWHFSHAGKKYPLPGFAGVLAFYTAGEEPDALLRRAEAALGAAKLKGDRRVQVV